MKHITSRDNPLFKELVRLVGASRATRREEGRVVLDGVHLVRAYLDCYGPEQVELVVKESTRGGPEIAALAQRARTISMADALFDQAAPVQSPVGVLAVVPLPQASGSRRKNGFQVLLDGVQDPGNLGSILRSAAAAGASVAHVSSACADPWSPKALRGGMGAQFLLPVEEHPDLCVLARRLEVPLVACTASAAEPIFDLDLRGEVAFIIGGEGAGISPGLLAEADRTARIPMRAGVESLNAGAAAAVCFYEWLRQQGSASAA